MGERGRGGEEKGRRGEGERRRGGEDLISQTLNAETHTYTTSRGRCGERDGEREMDMRYM